MDRVRIGFVGAGAMGQCAHLKNYLLLPDCEVAAIAELRKGLREKVAAKYGVARTYGSHEEMLAAEKLDGIVASQQFSLHSTLIPELLKAGKPVFIEKPLAVTAEAGEKIVEAAKDSGTWVMVGYHKRSDPATVYAKAEIERLKTSGEIGALRYVRITMPPGDWIAGGFDDLVRTDEKVPPLEAEARPADMDEAGYREYTAFVNYYIHQVNLMRHLLGEPYSVSYADAAGRLLAVRSASGVAGVIEMAPYSTSVDWQESALAGFERGYVMLELPAPLAANRPGRVTVMKGSCKGKAPESITPQLPWTSAMRRQAMNFTAAIKGEGKAPCSAEEALEDLKIARAYIDLLAQNRR
ncbi:MAG TPA: Gfo/Idh/MocA family oxidoreductase [Planctomycetes bacterium]|nr:Gfo/Idh/MocA family oxidoreductase [Planctomycetota bacterium]